MANTHPVVLVHGILGFGPQELGPLNYWGSALRVASPLKRHEASVGPLSSAHDRACELAAQIKGTRVDYGKDHSQQMGHERFGRDYSGKGFVPHWSEQNPIHLVGHSLGSPTIRCLQYLLDTDFWNWGSSNRWVCSLNTVSGVSNGSTLVYFFGADERTGLLDRDSAATPILRMLEMYTSATGGVLDSVYDFDLAHWGFQRTADESLVDYLTRVSRSDFLWGPDNAAYTLSLQAAYEDNGVWPTYPGTFYFSYVTEQTFHGWLSGRYYPQLTMNPAMLAPSTYIGQKSFAEAPIPTPGFEDTQWWENDGAVPTFSQKYPHISGDHPVGGEFDNNTPTDRFGTGKWYYKWEHSVDHLDVCVFPQLTQRGWQRRFYRRLFERLAALDVPSSFSA